MPPRAPDLKKYDAAAYEDAIRILREWVVEYTPAKMKTMLPLEKKRATDARFKVVSAVIPSSWPGHANKFSKKKTHVLCDVTEFQERVMGFHRSFKHRNTEVWDVA